MTVEAQLASAARCLLAYDSLEGPQLVPLACWSDGDALWMTPPSSAPVVEALRRVPECAVGIQNGTGLVATGIARVYASNDLLGLLVHGPIIAVAVTALAVRHPREVAQSWLQIRQPVAVRVAIDEVQHAQGPPLPPGIAPALPEVIPAEVRRRTCGVRRVVVASDGPRGLHIWPASWVAGFVLSGDLPVKPDAPVAVAVEGGGASVVLSGRLDARRTLRPARASWWDGARSGSAALSPTPRGGLRLPD